MNVLIVGLGSIAAKHINAIRRIDNSARIYALRSSTGAQEKDGITNLYSLDMIKNSAFDFAIVSNPTSEHQKTITALLNLKRPLFIEKPLSNTIALEDMVAAVKRSHVLTYIGCNLRFLESLLYVKQKIAKGIKRINEVNVYCGSYLPEWRPDIDFRTSYSARPELGGGVQLDLIHEIDYIYWLFGKPEKITKTFKAKSSLEISAIDYAHYCLEYNDFCVGITLNYYRKDYKRTLEILFDDDTWLVDLKQNKILSESTEIFTSSQQIIDTYFDQMNYFYRLVQNDATFSINTVEDAFEVLKIGI